ncbi:TPA: hypothetical protein H1005_00105 [archaeon]|uniref:Uncharacterized protein n=1 Tax=Candidatus Naiadarchaeum limnaeum TaxID=2756139 RepID=A0A832USR1_9ARCH|nr:hypothetical protein [Candidatus Naiadarchaeales archaeon SRR2090153.bin1042]HIK00812.1 hypothetical protein [Candidatus Naiadarchaeum limnaeum]
MRELRNVRADSSAVAIVGGVVIILLIGVVAIAFSGGVAAVSTGSIVKGQCKATIELKNKFNQKVDEKKNDIQEKVETQWWEYVLNPFTGIVHKVFIEGPVDWASEEAAKFIKIETDTCIENFPDFCPITIGKKATADLTADCVYRRAVDTFYTLQGGRGTGYEKRTIDSRKFNLFKLNVTVEEPGSVLVRGSCSTYLAQQAIWTDAELTAANKKDCEVVVGDGKGSNYVCGYQFDPNWCNITFSRVTETTMTLTMISRCQQEGSGPDQTRFCKCFYNEDTGYQTFNGLPNANVGVRDTSRFNDFASEIGATYTHLDSKYSGFKGCGARPILTPKTIFLGIGEGFTNDNIKASQLNVLPGQEKTYYTRLEDTNGDGIGEVIISDYEQ